MEFRKPYPTDLDDLPAEQRDAIRWYANQQAAIAMRCGTISRDTKDGYLQQATQDLLDDPELLNKMVEAHKKYLRTGQGSALEVVHRHDGLLDRTAHTSSNLGPLPLEVTSPPANVAAIGAAVLIGAATSLQPVIPAIRTVAGSAQSIHSGDRTPIEHPEPLKETRVVKGDWVVRKRNKHSSKKTVLGSIAAVGISMGNVNSSAQARPQPFETPTAGSNDYVVTPGAVNPAGAVVLGGLAACQIVRRPTRCAKPEEEIQEIQQEWAALEDARAQEAFERSIQNGAPKIPGRRT